MNKDYKDLLFIQNSPDGKKVNLSLEGESIKINDQYKDLYLPISDLEFSLGGESNSYIVAKGNDMTLFIKSTHIIDDLISKTNSEKLIKIKEGHKKSKHGLKFTIVSLFAMVAVFLLIGYIIFQSVIFFISKNVPVSWEEKIGQIALTTTVTGKSANDPSLLKAVEKIGNYLDSKSDNDEYKIKFYVVKDKQVNAFALPGGYIAVNTGLLEKSDSPEEVAAVLAHELQHVYKKHAVEAIVKNIGFAIFLNLTLGDISSLAYIGSEIVGLKFSRDDEREADALGAQLLDKSGINPNSMISFFKKLQAINKDLPASVEFISTHPLTDERIKILQNLIATKYKKPSSKTFDIDWKQIKEKASKE
ncbi:MAG: M48 family metallopeptidase [Candidatus Sericytochromatia bacterium]|nr:M48 family metallopeptidase [Candidatus Sericytochromatia bacterium]